MTRDTKEKSDVRVAETGWAKARRVRERKVRTCVAALVDGSAPPALSAGREGNIVRGED
ncbi:hypothetical protein ACWD4G_32760 [Streptomyces sp. NPDC002643]